MINAAIVTSPMEIGMERGSSVGVQKSQPDGPEFGSVLESKINEQREQTREAKPVETPKAQEHSEPKAADKVDAKAEAQTETEVETKVEAEPDAKAQDAVEAKPVDDQAAQVAADQAAEQVAAQAAGEVAAAATLAEAAVAAKGQFTELVPEQAVNETTQAVEQTQVTVEAPSVAVSQDVSMESMLASAIGQQDTSEEEPAELPITDAEGEALISENAEKSAQAGAEIRSQFFGPTARQSAQAMVEAQMKVTGANAGVGSLYGGMGDEVTKTSDEPVENPLISSAKNLAQQGVTSEVLFSAAFKPTDGMAKDVTFSPQVIAAIMQDTEQKTEVVQAVDGSESAGSEGAGASQTQTGTQDASFVIPGRTSFESVIRGLDAAAPTAPSAPTNTEAYTKIIDQVVREIRLRQFQGGSDLMVKLNPAELGQIRLQISQTAEGLTSQIHASSEQVKGLLQAHLPALTEALSNAGLKMDQVTVTSGASFGSLMQDNTSGTAYQQRNKQRHNQSGGHQDMMVNPALINAANAAALGGSAGYSWLA